MLGTKIRMVVQRDTWNYQITKTVLVEKMAQTSSIWLLVVKKRLWIHSWKTFFPKRRQAGAKWPGLEMV